MKRYLILCLVALLAQLNLYAQFPQWESFHTTTRINDFRSIGQDIWVATDAGIYVYNKSSRVVAHLDRSNTDLPSNQVEAIAVDDLNRVWIGTYDMEMAYKQGDEWVRVNFPEGLFDEEEPLLLYCMAFGPDGSLWVGTNKGLVRRNGDDWHIFDQATNPSSFLRNVWDIVVLPDGHIYAASFMVCHINPAGELSLAGTTGERPFSYSDAQLDYDPVGGALWHINDIGEVSRLDTAGNWQQWSIQQDFPGANSQLIDLALSPSGETWVLSSYDGAYRFEDEQWVASELVHAGSLAIYFDADSRVETQDKNFNFITGEQVTTAAFQDHPLEWTLNAGVAEEAGAMTFVHNGHFISYNEGNWSAPDSLVYQGLYQPAYELVQGVDGSRYAFAGQKVWRFLPAQGQWQLVGTSGLDYPAAGLHGATVAPDGSLWVFGYQHGLLHYQEGQWTIYEQPFFAISFIPRMACDANGLLWMYYIQTVSGTVSGIATFDGQNLDLISPAEIGFDPGYIYQIKTKGTDVYLASYYEGLVHYDGQSWQRIQAPGPVATPNRVTALAISDNQRLAYAIPSQGVWVRDQDSWLQFTSVNSPISSDPVYQLLWSKQTEDLWIIQQRAEVHVYHGDWTTGNPQLDPAEEGILQLYPNPAQDVLWLDWREWYTASRTCELTLCDEQGRHLARYVCEPGTTQIQWPIAHLPAGVYLIMATDGVSLHVQKWIKQ